ncbi:MAG: Bcr/CflA family efflux MFS transporter [Rhodococcus sp. (in: high G+C Gram-positive bacteria)]|uniref:multidrug effflux MFS transporter n=1 Tax=Rhodococcus sp. TaxID=1831 RepID=UPI0012269DB5|nr:multidrug effflux MFS transporter [Rhodococcus sp. (in: high G+C Gram-positive bacteria)]RZL23766.1 MAG: Bcr/CflA family efflux MFS transporter [Rhodococcus sp. (in: high G+C Gram-positive bacteria)]
MLCILALISAIAPLSTDMYLPGLPIMAESLDTSAASVQLTLTTFMAGLGIGQLIIGPISDGIGRRRLLLGAAAITTLASAACALAPNIEFLIGARLIQGLSGGAAIVLARACIADRARGNGAAKLFSIMMIIGGVAPVVAPLLGGVLLGPVGWRGIFWVLTAAGAVMVAGVLTLVPETLPPERRHGGGLKALVANLGYVTGNRRYLGYALAFIFGFGALFSYIAASPFVVQNVLGLTPSQFSMVFAVNAVGMVAAATITARLLGRLSARTLLNFGVSLLTISGAVLFCTAALFNSTNPAALLIPLFVSVSSIGFIMGNATALAQGEVTAAAGTGSALMGAGQFGLAAAVSPLVGIAGPDTAVPMAIAIPTFGLLAALSLALFARKADAAN